MARKWWTLLTVCVAVFMLLLDITIVNVALPSIQRSLHSSFSNLQWVVDAYALTLAALLLTAGSLGDLVGRRRVFAVGLGVFTVASLLCGLATSPLMLNLARAVQGIGGAVMFATSLALIAQEFHGRERGTAFGAWGGTIGVAVAIGPLVGGALTDALSWKWIFFINVPIGAGAVALTLTRLAESRAPHARRIDWPGLILFSTALFLLVFALIRGNTEGWGSPQIVGFLAGATALLALFVAVELRAEDPMLDLTLFRKPTFIGASVAAFALSSSMFALFLYITLYIQNILGFAPLQAGLRFLPLTLLSFTVSPLAGRLSARLPMRALMSVGLGLVALGLVLMHGVTTSSGWTALLAGFIVAGAGIGLVNPPLASTSIGVVEPQRSGMASGINNTFRQVGIATGIAGLGAVFQSEVASRVTHNLAHAQAGLAAQAHRLGELVASGNVGSALHSVPPQTRPVLGGVARSAFVGGLNEILLIGVVVAAIGAVLTLFLVRASDFVVAPTAAESPAAAS